MRGVTGSLQGVSSEGEGDGRPSRGAGGLEGGTKNQFESTEGPKEDIYPVSSP